MEFIIRSGTTQPCSHMIHMANAIWMIHIGVSSPYWWPNSTQLVRAGSLFVCPLEAGLGSSSSSEPVFGVFPTAFWIFLLCQNSRLSMSVPHPYRSGDRESLIGSTHAGEIRWSTYFFVSVLGRSDLSPREG